MGSRDKLSHKLLELGFFSALGTSEHPGLATGVAVRACHVRRKKPNTWDSNNGVTVVYDELGRPWIIRRENTFKIVDFGAMIIHAYNLERGAYVPHSNDGGWFITEVIPGL